MKRPFLGADGFVQGWQEYLDRYPGTIDYRIVISVRFENLVARPVIVDTGTPYCILRPQEASLLNFDYRAAAVDTPRF